MDFAGLTALCIATIWAASGLVILCCTIHRHGGFKHGLTSMLDSGLRDREFWHLERDLLCSTSRSDRSELSQRFRELDSKTHLESASLVILLIYLLLGAAGYALFGPVALVALPEKRRKV